MPKKMLSRLAALLIAAPVALAPAHASDPHAPEAAPKDAAHTDAHAEEAHGMETPHTDGHGENATPAKAEGEAHEAHGDGHAEADTHAAGSASADAKPMTPAAKAEKPVHPGSAELAPMAPPPAAPVAATAPTEAHANPTSEAPKPVPSAQSASDLKDIRIGAHGAFVRVVLDLAAPVSFAQEGAASVRLKDIAAGSAVFNAERGQAPLKRVVIAQDNGGALVTFETSETVSLKSFALTPDTYGGHRLVVDLRRPGTEKARTAPRTVEETLTPSDSRTGPGRGPAVLPAQQSASLAPAAITGATAPPAAAANPAMIDAAEAALAKGDAAEACAKAKGALADDPRNVRARTVLGQCLLALGDAAGARLAFKDALLIEADFAAAKQGLADAEAVIAHGAGH